MMQKKIAWAKKVVAGAGFFAAVRSMWWRMPWATCGRCGAAGRPGECAELVVVVDMVELWAAGWSCCRVIERRVGVIR